ncbi:hypothetical protein [Inconstantimicrobium porci]|uniref:hypothetical protein n=1 Tax=Inconstantimicrobium porci TaxID=2652291 RepID=UPI002409C1C6|nr:hypothetical protein [Inconstantimicrobium porci]MDD6771568.1 hypothetical protein [Inconstantimicrobium porci]
MPDIITRKAIDKLTSKLNEEGRKYALAQFLSTYFLCEMSYKKVLSSYHKTQGISDTRNNMKIFYDDIDKVLGSKNIIIDAEIKELLFSNKRKIRGDKSARVLRDSLAHNININDIEEIFIRNSEIVNAMNTFLMTF